MTPQERYELIYAKALKALVAKERDQAITSRKPKLPPNASKSGGAKPVVAAAAKKRRDKVYRYIKANGPCPTGEVLSHMGCTTSQAWNDVHELSRSGRIVKADKWEGKQRWVVAE